MVRLYQINRIFIVYHCGGPSALINSLNTIQFIVYQRCIFLRPSAGRHHPLISCYCLPIDNYTTITEVREASTINYDHH